MALNELFRRWHCKQYRRITASGGSAWAVTIHPITLAKGEWTIGPKVASGGEMVTTVWGAGLNEETQLFDELEVVAVTPFEAVNVFFEWLYSRDQDQLDWIPDDWLVSPHFRADWCEARWPKLPNRIGEANEMTGGE